MSANDNRTTAEQMIEYAYAGAMHAQASSGELTEEDGAAISRVGVFATAHALLAVEARLGELAEQQKLMTAVNIYVTGAGNLGAAHRETLRAFIASRISEFEQ